ncbi:hypothetical protein BV25DRAFT_1416757 [Artomyces pyxidatus]|uniref:Uncharacterized protein n=1 Tax=Artomyces pyxidatus TaxID=48021 RepID=A0ACB8TE04_9AGAM|nr:hypothetical protein BV25DRAFT_1416757 [Artomyces pyxidatus]
MATRDRLGYDFCSFTVELQTVWIFDLRLDAVDSFVKREDGAPVEHILTCSGKTAKSPRLWVRTSNLTSQMVFDFFRRSVAHPEPPNRPCLPQLLFIGTALMPYIDVLQPFLDSIPTPFIWTLESPWLAEMFRTATMDDDFWFRTYIEVGLEATKSGREALRTRRDPDGAIRAYTSARRWMLLAVKNYGSGRKDQVLKLTKFSLADCIAGLALAYLMRGPGMDVKMALVEAQNARQLCSDNAKAIYCEATAYEITGEIDKFEALVKDTMSKLAVDKRDWESAWSEHDRATGHSRNWYPFPNKSRASSSSTSRRRL